MNKPAHHGIKAALCLVAAAFMLRALITLGWMPVATDGTIRLVLCDAAARFKLLRLLSTAATWRPNTPDIMPEWITPKPEPVTTAPIMKMSRVIPARSA